MVTASMSFNGSSASGFSDFGQANTDQPLPAGFGPLGPLAFGSRRPRNALLGSELSDSGHKRGSVIVRLGDTLA